MKITILGCGSSGGVPLIGNDWGSCDPSESRNTRTRVSVLVEIGEAAILIDTSPDMRQQLLTHDIRRVTSVIYTHAHADHCHGIDDLRSMNWLMHKPIDIHADAHTMYELVQRFPYIFKNRLALNLDHPDDQQYNNFYKPALVPNIFNGQFVVDGIDVIPFEQDHGFSKSWGFRIGDFAYSTDAKNLDEHAFSILTGVKVWVVDCVREAPHPTHSHLSQTLEWVERVKPQHALLTHMNHFMDYQTIKLKCPVGVEPAYDGQIIKC
jgi:phosphoribosyl 1,2-cyclic phosphate phosphodiesterase